MAARRSWVLVLAFTLAASALGMSPAGAAAADASGPVAEWTFDEVAGTTAQDAVGSLDGTLNGGVTRIADGVPQGAGALQFDGVDDLVTVGNAPALEPSGAFTLSLWMRSADSAHTTSAVVSKGDFGCAAGGSWEVLRNWSELSGGVKVAGYGYGRQLSSWGNWVDAAWHHVTLAVDPSSGSQAIWVDGHQRSFSWPGPEAIDYDGPDLIDSTLRIGGSGPGCPDRTPFKGAVDDVRLWSRALSSAEIMAQLPVASSTTELGLWLESNGSEGAEITAAYVDQRLVYRVRVLPWPAVTGDVTWYRSRNGGPEEVFATTPLRVDDMQGYVFTFQEPGSLEPGDYTIRATWAGSAYSQPSSSAAFPLTITRRPVSMETSAMPASLVPGESTTVTARVAVANPPHTYVVSGNIDVYETTGGMDQLLGTGALTYTNDPTWNTATIPVPPVGAGVHTYEARFPGTATLAPAVAVVAVAAGPQASYTGVRFTPNPVLNTDHATAEIGLATYRKSPGGDTPAPTGTLTFREQPSGTVVATIPVTGNGLYEVSLPQYAVGTRQFSAEYSGDASFDPSASATETLTIAADVVEASGIGVSATSLYPYKDGYRDTVTIRGTRDEPASVAIRITSPTNRTVKTAAVSMGGGAYSVTWNGRNGSGKALAAGRYTVVQTLTDAAGTKRSVTSHVSVSAKRLYYTTVTLTKAYANYSKKTASWIAWNFTLPSAAAYKSLVFSVKGKTSIPPGAIGPQDFTLCGASYYSPNCVARSRSLPFKLGWVSVTGSASRDRSGRTVRLFAWASYGGTASVAYGKVKVTYGVLK